MSDIELLELAKAEVFSAAIIPTSKIVTDGKFRPFFEENLCGNYYANYSCHPDCGTVEETRQRLMAEDRRWWCRASGALTAMRTSPVFWMQSESTTLPFCA